MWKPTFAVAIAITAYLGPVAAAPAREPLTVTDRVYYGDLDLSTPAGAKALLRRMKASVRRLCPDPSPLLRPRYNATDARRCRATALRRAIAALGEPLVTAEYDRTARRILATTAQ